MNENVEEQEMKKIKQAMFAFLTMVLCFSMWSATAYAAPETTDVFVDGVQLFTETYY